MANLETNGKTIETNFGELGLPVTLVDSVQTPLGETHFFNLKDISQFNMKYIDKLLDKIGTFHRVNLKAERTKQAHFKVIWLYDNASVSLTKLLAENGYRDMVIGVDSEGKLVTLDFDKIPHLLIAGTTGGGKSVLLRNILFNIFGWYGKNRFGKGEVVIIDPKGTEFNRFKNLVGTTYVSTTEQAIKLMKIMCNEMDSRYENGGKYERETYIIIDELADLMLTSRFEVEQDIVRIAQKGRAVGMHLIVATQNPKIEVCSGLIKANMPYRIALKTASIRESITILDQKGAEQLKGCGDALFKNGINLIRFQVAFPEKQLEDLFVRANEFKG